MHIVFVQTKHKGILITISLITFNYGCKILRSYQCTNMSLNQSSISTLSMNIYNFCDSFVLFVLIISIEMYYAPMKYTKYINI